MTDEQLIELVKQYPVLYNKSLSQYRDHNMRNNAWEDIAAQMNTPVEEVKSKWGKLRNCFTNALKRRRKKSGQAATTIVPWKFEKQMEFLLSYLEGRQTITNISPNGSDIINEDDSTEDSELQFCEQSAHSPSPVIRTPTPNSTGNRACTSSASAVTASNSSFTPRRTNKNDSDSNLLKQMVDVMKSSHEMRQKRASADMDDNDYFFLSMSKQLKKLPKTDQAEIKFKLHQLIHESEMKMLNNCERILNTPINITSTKIIPLTEPLTEGNTLINAISLRPCSGPSTSLIIPNQTRSYNQRAYQIMSNPILTQYRNDDHSLPVQNDVSEVEVQETQDESSNLTERYDNFSG